MFSKGTEAPSSPPKGASERRRAQRFALSLPVRIVKLRQQKVNIHSETRDVSSAGAYFLLEGAHAPAGAPIEFFLTLERDGNLEHDSTEPDGKAPDGSVELHCRGRIVRVEEVDGSKRAGVGASIDRYQFVRPRDA